MQDLDGASQLDSGKQKDKDVELEVKCQNPECHNKQRAVRVCHHSDCRSINHHRPFLLCLDCDREIHGQRFRSGHLCLDIPKKRGQFLHSAIITENGDCKRSNRRIQSEGGRNTDQKLCRCDRINKNNKCQQHFQGNDISSCSKQHQKNVDDNSSEKNRSDNNDICIFSEDNVNSNDQQCKTNEKSTKDSPHLNFALKDDSSVERSNGVHCHSFQQLTYKRSHSHDSLCKSELGSLHNNRENSRKDQLNNGLPDNNHLENCNGNAHLDGDHVSETGNSGSVGNDNVVRSDSDQFDDHCENGQVDDPSDSDQLNNRCHDHDKNCGRTENQSDQQSCDDDIWTVNTQQFDNTSQDFDADSTDPESSNWSHRLIRKKAMKIRKQKPAESVSRLPEQEPSQSDGVNSSVNASDADGKTTIPDELSKTKRTSTNVQPDAREHWTCTQKPPLPKHHSDVIGHDTQTADKLINTNLKESRTLPCSVGNLTLLPNSKPSNMSENSRTRYISSANLRSACFQDETRRKPFTTRMLGSSKMHSGEFFRKFSLTNEYFTLRFGADEQMIVAPKGLSLGRAISSIITEKWCLKLDQCDIFLNSSNSALPLSSDCYLLANNTLFVRVKLDERKNGIDHIVHLTGSSISPSTPALTEKGKLNGNIKNSKKSGSSEDCLSTDALSSYATLSQSDLQKLRNAKGPSKLQSLFQFSKPQDKQEQLVELLLGYSTNGLPKMPDLLTLGRPHYDPSIFHLEQHWKDIVNGHASLTKHQRDQQEAIWELLTTEVEYIRKLRVVIDLFMCCLFNLQNEQLLNEIEADKLFSNIDDVYFATCHFWNAHMSQVLQRSRETREPLNPSLLKSGFLVFDKIFEPYTKYCLEQDMCQDYIRSKTKENELFRIYIQWGQSQKQCRLLRLQDIMCGPWQRLMRYRLLLKEILKHTEQTENSTPDDQIHDLENTIEQVEKFVAEVNVAMRHREESKLMSKLINRIESYDAVEAPNEECIKLLDKFSRLDLVSPVAGCGSREMRLLLFEGSLKLKDAFSKIDVYCFLFTDLFLVTKPVTKRSGDKVKVIKPPMRLDKIVVHRLRDPASFVVLYLNEYHVAQAIYTFHGDSRLWTESLKKAQSDYKDKRYQYLMQSDSIFTDYHDNEDEDEDYATFVDSSLTMDLARDPESFSRCNSSSSTDTFLPNYVSELSLLSAVDPPKDDFRAAYSLQRRRRGLASNPRLNGSCDQLVLGGKESYPYVPRKSFLSHGTVGSGSKVFKSDGTSMEDLTDQMQSEESRSDHANDRHHSDSVWRKTEREMSLRKRLSWNCETTGTGSTMKETFSRIRNHAMSRSKSPATHNTRQCATDLESSVVPRQVEYSHDGCKMSADSENFEPSPSQNSSSVLRNGHDTSRTNRIKTSASMPVFPKLTVMDSAVIDKTSEVQQNPSDVQRHQLDKAFLLKDCTLEATDV